MTAILSAFLILALFITSLIVFAKGMFDLVLWPFRALAGIITNLVNLRRLSRGELPTGETLPVVAAKRESKEKH